ncbi:MAG: replication-relaxation family protein [Acidobacteriota bacterium]|nr:replication-relaxation family protein [Acidobacteriota bacterium]
MTDREGRQVRVGAAATAALASRLTERDRLVALACYEHRVLTTEQLRRLHFGSSRRCCARLEQLHRLRVLDRFRPARERGQGSAPYHWVLDEAGAHVVAACLGLERSELRWRHQAAIAISRSGKLAHQLEVNEFFTRLAGEAAAAGGRLADWWGERRCLSILGGQVAPDGYGRLVLPGRRPVSLLLELDRATEDQQRLRQKARRYAKALPRSVLADEQPLLLVAVPTPARRDNLAATLASASLAHRVVVWTPQRSPLEALRAALDELNESSSANAMTDLAPLPAPDD